MTIKDRLHKLICKILSIKIIGGIVLPTFLVCFKVLPPSMYIVILLAALGFREVSKKFKDKFSGGN